MNIVTVMGEQKELRFSHPASLTQHLLVVVVSEVVLGKRSQGFVAARDSIPYDTCYA